MKSCREIDLNFARRNNSPLNEIFLAPGGGRMDGELSNGIGPPDSGKNYRDCA